jgi:hypothetical protein
MSAISTTLRDFATKPLADAGEELFKTLGYGTEIQQRYASLKGLLEAFDTGGKVAKAFGPLGKRERSEPVLLQQLTHRRDRSELWRAIAIDGPRRARHAGYQHLPLSHRGP